MLCWAGAPVHAAPRLRLPPYPPCTHPWCHVAAGGAGVWSSSLAPWTGTTWDLPSFSCHLILVPLLHPHPHILAMSSSSSSPSGLLSPSLSTCPVPVLIPFLHSRFFHLISSPCSTFILSLLSPLSQSSGPVLVPDALHHLPAVPSALSPCRSWT